MLNLGSCTYTSRNSGHLNDCNIKEAGCSPHPNPEWLEDCGLSLGLEVSRELFGSGENSVRMVTGFDKRNVIKKVAKVTRNVDSDN